MNHMTLGSDLDDLGRFCKERCSKVKCSNLSEVLVIWCSLVLDLLMPPHHLLERQFQAEIAGRTLLKKSYETSRNLRKEYGVCHETSLNLGKAYGVCPLTVRNIVDEFKDKIDEAEAAARRVYENNPRSAEDRHAARR